MMTKHSASALPMPQTRPAILPTALEQYAARAAHMSGFGNSGLMMLLATVALWGGLWLAMDAARHAPDAAPAAVRAHQPLPRTRFLLKPEITLALAEKPAAPATPEAALGRDRAQAHIRDDLMSLLGHVAQSLLKDEFDSIVLRLSLGEQVAVHLKRDFLR